MNRTERFAATRAHPLRRGAQAAGPTRLRAPPGRHAALRKLVLRRGKAAALRTDAPESRAAGAPARHRVLSESPSRRAATRPLTGP